MKASRKKMKKINQKKKKKERKTHKKKKGGVTRQGKRSRNRSDLIDDHPKLLGLDLSIWINIDRKKLSLRRVPWHWGPHEFDASQLVRELLFRHGNCQSWLSSSPTVKQTLRDLESDRSQE